MNRIPYPIQSASPSFDRFTRRRFRKAAKRSAIQTGVAMLAEVLAIALDAPPFVILAASLWTLGAAIMTVANLYRSRR